MGLALNDPRWRKIALFPFLNSSKEVLIKKDYSIDSIIKDFPNILLDAKNNLELILDNIENFVKKEIVDSISDALSYPIQNAVVAYLNDRWFTNRYSEAYAKRTRKFLDKLTKKPDKVFEVEFLEELGIKLEEDSKNQRTFKMLVLDFIELATKIESADLDSESEYKAVANKFKLSNSVLNAGWVENLNKKDLSNLFTAALRQNFKNKIKEIAEHIKENKLPAKLMDMADIIRDRILDFKQEHNIGEFYSGTVYNDAFPSCINNAYIQLLEGKNLDHQERLVFEFFCLNIGMSKEEILNLFAHSPDYREDISKYMINHAENKRYMSYSCKKIKAFGLCKINYKNDPYNWCINGKIKNPLNFFKKMTWVLEQRIIPSLLCYPFIITQKISPKKRNKDSYEKRSSLDYLIYYLKRTSKKKK